MPEKPTNDRTAVACSLGAGELGQRLAAIAALGADSLLARGVEGNRHVLRFRPDASTRRRLEAIVAAEARCCAFLDLSLREHGGELVLSISAPEDAQAFADGLAEVFYGRAFPALDPDGASVESVFSHPQLRLPSPTPGGRGS
jgi:hypothetical protein